MEIHQIVLAITMFVCGALIAWLAVASWKRSLPLNEISGYRTETVMTNEEVWTEAHYAAAPWTALAAGASLISAIGYFFTSSDAATLVWTIVSLVVLSLGVAVGAVVAQKTAKEILARSPQHQ